MANKRDLKKQIRYICGDLAAECLIAGEYVDGIDRKSMRAIVCKIATLQQDALQRCSFSFDKVPSDFNNLKEYHVARKAYFKQAYNTLREKFNKHVLDIVKDMNAAVPKEVKEANKK